VFPKYLVDVSASVGSDVVLADIYDLQDLIFGEALV
jgi:hypothetical protein